MSTNKDPLNTRKVTIEGKGVNLCMLNVKKGDRFQVFEKDGTPVCDPTDPTGNFTFEALGDAYVKPTGVICVQCKPVN